VAREALGEVGAGLSILLARLANSTIAEELVSAITVVATAGHAVRADTIADIR